MAEIFGGQVSYISMWVHAKNQIKIRCLDTFFYFSGFTYFRFLKKLLKNIPLAKNSLIW